MANQIIKPLEDEVIDIKKQSLYARLKRLFSTDVIVRNIGGKQLKIKDTDNIMYATDRNSMRDRFNRIRSTAYNAYTRDFSLSYQSARMDLFRDYDTMDMDPIISSCLDIYADESLTYNELGKMITVHSSNNNVKSILENLFDEILNVKFNLWSWVRNMTKYGDCYLKLYITPEYGIYMVEPISAYNVERIENSDPYNKRYVKFQVRPTDTAQAEVLENYEMAHFRLISDSNFLPYGKCLDGNTNISTTNGPKLIQNINIGDIVYSFDFDNNTTVTAKVLDKIMSGIKTVYEIKTAHRTIRATAEHPFLTKDGLYKSVNNLTLSDYLILPTLNNEFTDSIKYPKLIIEETDIFKFDSKLQILNEDILKSKFKEFVRFYGFLLGDGWLDKSSKSVAFSLGNRLDKSKKYLDFITELGLRYRLTNGMFSDSSVNVNSVYLYELILQLGFITGSSNKLVPSWIWDLPLDIKQELLFGFADAYGCDIDENSYQLSSINKQLIDDLRTIAMECGLSITKTWNTIGSGYNPDCKSYFFAYRLKSRDFIEFKNGHHVEKIRSIVECNKTEVYDIQVDNELHNFIAEGIVVHNSMIEGGRRIWKQLSLMEDAMLIHRVMRAPEKRIFYTDIGNIPPAEVDTYMQRMMDKMKKVPYMDEQTGEYNLRFNLQNMVEDYYIPVRGGDSGTKIDTLGGMEWTGTEDIEYVKNKMMAAFKIPKAFLGFEEGIGGKSTLAAEDVRFARTIQRLQRIITSELSKIAIVHLYSQGYRDESLVDFELELTNPSTIFEKEKIEIWSDKVSVATDMVENKFFSYNWIYKNIFNMSDDDIKIVQDEVVEDAKQKYRFTSIEEDGDDPAKPYNKIGGDGDGDGGDNKGGYDGGLGDLGGGGGSSKIPDLGDLGDLGGDKKGGDKEKKGGLGGLKETITPKKDLRDRSDRDQSGERDARSEHPFGEDPLGQNEMDPEKKKKSEGKRKSEIGHNYEGGSPLSLKEMKHPILPAKAIANQALNPAMINSLSVFLKKTHEQTKQELLKENTTKESKSLLDESNILTNI